MATLARVRYSWTGAPVVGGGVSTFYSSNSSPAVLCTALDTFFAACVGACPDGTVVLSPGSGDTVESTTGQVNGTWTRTPGAPINGTSTATWAAGVGLRVQWLTSGIRNGRRVRGSTFIVPITGAFMNTDGSISSTTVSNIQTAANTLVAADSGSLRIFSRPSNALAADGVAHPVTSALVDGRVTWLRSRRT